MDTNAKIVGLPSAVAPASPASAGGSFDQSRDDQAPEGPSRYRLVIEEGPGIGSFVYKTLDAVTGEVVRQFPREQVVRLAEAREYDAGAVIDTTA